MKNAVRKILQAHIDADFSLEKPKNSSLGDFATPVAFSLAKIQRKNPMQIAENLAQELKNIDIFDEVTSLNGYVNFKFSGKFLDDYAKEILQTNFALPKNEEKILVEFVSANPTGPLHMGHTRGAVVGDTLCRVGEHLGFNMTREYYINDFGNQIHLLGLSIWLAGREDVLKLDVKYPEEYYRGEYINDTALLAAKEFGEDIFKDEANIQKLCVWGKDKMLEIIKKNLFDLKVVFDNFVSEKSLHENWENTKALLQKNGKTYEKDGKIWLKSSDFGDEKDRVITREDGRPTYIAGDIVYHEDKFKRNFDRYINIFGADHHGYIKRMEAAINFLGYDETKLETILTQMVSLLKNGEPFKMSKRAGNFILMSDLIEEIGSDALRYIFISKKSDTHLEFDLDTLTKEDGSNPVYYINYAHARINQLFNKANKSFSDVKNASLSDLDDESKTLLFNALLLNESLKDAFNARQMQKITDYLYNLSSLTHKFYNEHKVINSDKEDVYLKILGIVKQALKKGLELIGIEAKEIMHKD